VDGDARSPPRAPPRVVTSIPSPVGLHRSVSVSGAAVFGTNADATAVRPPKTGVAMPLMWPFPAFAPTHASAPSPIQSVAKSLATEMIAADAKRSAASSSGTSGGVLNRVVYDSMLPPEAPVRGCQACITPSLMLACDCSAAGCRCRLDCPQPRGSERRTVSGDRILGNWPGIPGSRASCHPVGCVLSCC
jgi:hypothetical protein